MLESIRDLLAEDSMAPPPWLHDILLGYGDPGAAAYRHQSGCLRTVDFKDTFLDADHVREAFPGWSVQFHNRSRSAVLERPFRITFPPLSEEQEAAEAAEAAEGATGGKRKATATAADGDQQQQEAQAARRTLVVESYTPVDPGPYPQDLPPQNAVRFTPVQTQAIMAGVQPGLTMVVGPPGEEKERRKSEVWVDGRVDWWVRSWIGGWM